MPGPDDSRSSGVAPGAISALIAELARAPERAAEDTWAVWLYPGAAVGRFQLVREIGRGGFGVVWEARDTELGRSVAFKAVRATDRSGLQQQWLVLEAEAAARLSHPNIVTLHDLGRSEHGPYLVLELLQGKTLAERLAEGPVAPREAIRIGVEVARALSHAHAHEVIHRDLKPGNVFLCDDGQVKVLDFGLALVFGGHASPAGTPGFMAPEQARGEPGDPRTDLFALGVLLFRMLSGRLPFQKSAPAIPPPLSVPGVPAVGALVARLLEPDPDRRPRTAGDVASALAAILREAERTGLRAALPQADVRAYEYYLRGRQYLEQTRRKSLRFARELFSRAVEVDPGFALAHAGLAEAAALLHMYYPPDEAELRAAEAECARALQLQPDLPEAHAVLGLACSLSKRPEEAARAFERAFALAPDLPEAHYYAGRAAFQAGRLEEAARRFREAARLREHYQAAFFAAQASEALGRHDEAREAYANALAVVERHMDLNPDDPRAATMRAVSLCRLGRREAGLQWAQQAGGLDPEDPGVRYNVACLFALEGEAEKALDALEYAVRAGFGHVDWIARDPDLASLRDHPRYKALLGAR